MKRSSILLAGVGLLVLGIAACLPILGIDVAIRLRPEEAWIVEMELKLASSANALIDASYISSLEQEFASQGMTAEIGELRSDGDGNLILPIALEGSGLATLNELIFSDPDRGFSRVEDKPGRLRLFGEMDYSMGAYPVTVRIRAARVISTNGQREGFNTVVWTNPQGALEGEFDTNTNLAIYITMAGVGLMGTGAVLGLARRGKRSQPVMPPAPYFQSQTALNPKPEYPLQPLPPSLPMTAPQRFCIHCGKPQPAQAGFCPHCGKSSV